MQYAPSVPQPVFGLQIHDPHMARLTRRVLLVSIVSGVLAVFNAIRSSGGEPAYATLFGIFFALLVPACGYFGAKRSDETLTCCFCGCNLLSAVFQIIALVGTYLAAKSLEYLAESCKSIQSSSCEPQIREQFEAICKQKGQSFNNHDCYNYIEKTVVPNLNSILTSLVIIAVPTILLYCMGFCWGNQLYRKIKEGHVVVPLPEAAAPMTVRAVQPLPAAQTAAQFPVQPSAPPASFRSQV
ncbi:unnamed protein product [Prorocentrum cordatum]|nr:unnamed protein product [Polarella glacialis]|mmetsp:Transcript_110285/g.291140  ORF Transcript_110285/g.291140 Transcript_110285/m.291140 type:complete len:241 (-) Transcript_110285:50-772(-)